MRNALAKNAPSPAGFRRPALMEFRFSEFIEDSPLLRDPDAGGSSACESHDLPPKPIAPRFPNFPNSAAAHDLENAISFRSRAPLGALRTRDVFGGEPRRTDTVRTRVEDSTLDERQGWST